jgi:Outer membrane lipoprotein-sorting protein
MKTLSLHLAFVIFALQLAAARGADPAAEELLGRMLDAQNTRGAMIRAKLVVTDAATNEHHSAQLRVKVRRDDDCTRLLYLVLWPRLYRGQALYFERTRDGTVTGFLFEPPDQVTPLTQALLSRSFLDSDLSVEDLAEDFWRWPSPAISGEETVKGDPCKIIDLHPPPGLKTSCSLVRAWISARKAAPLRLEKFGSDGSLSKRFVVEKVVRQDKVWTPVTTTIQVPNRTRETTLEISNGDRDIEIPLEEFSLEAIRKSAQSLNQEPPTSGKSRESK